MCLHCACVIACEYECVSVCECMLCIPRERKRVDLSLPCIPNILDPKSIMLESRHDTKALQVPICLIPSFVYSRIPLVKPGDLLLCRDLCSSAPRVPARREHPDHWGLFPCPYGSLSHVVIYELFFFFLGGCGKVPFLCRPPEKHCFIPSPLYHD